MANSKAIKSRIKSVKNTKKITKAMELVAASKMKRALSSTLATRPYAEYSWEVLTSIADSLAENSHPLFTQRPVNNTLLILITSNRGLCGAYNAQVVKKALTLLKTDSTNIDVVTIGKKGDVSMRRVGKKVVASFTDLPDHISLRDILPISKLVVDEYTKENYDRVYVAYTDFVSALTQKPNIKQVLPVSKVDLKELIDSLEKIKPEEHVVEKKVDYLIEGDIELLIGSLAEKITRMQIYQMLLESNASEQSSRMVAMKNASEASGEMIDDLTLIFNKARQSNITREISEISAGMASMS
ncbi:MAG: ATP synthase F1 subunit gamma [Candidatus Pacebacteria bacterium]|nr:ATP synthase F1 subunit gamma [Candidatus Paceibacterota bacterium]